MTREAFVSGLPGVLRGPAAPSHEHRRGLELLGHIKALALDQVEQLEPLSRERWDGVERHPADDTAAAQCEVYAAILKLVDVVVSDEAIKTLVAPRLAKGAR